jgi:thiol-disulfide isomerase/thioredoxin
MLDVAGRRPCGAQPFLPEKRLFRVAAAAYHTPPGQAEQVRRFGGNGRVALSNGASMSNLLKRMGQTCGLCVVAAIAMLAIGRVAASAAPTTAPSDAAAATPRSIEQIMADFQQLATQLNPDVQPATLSDPVARAAAAPKAIPLLKKLISLSHELRAAGGQGVIIADQVDSQLPRILVMFGDPDAVAAAKADAAGPDPIKAVHAQQSLLFSQWVDASKDPAAQGKILDSLAAMAKAHPDDVWTTQTLVMFAQLGAADHDTSQRAMDLAGGMQNPMASQIATQAQSDKKLNALVSKPLTIAGATVDGKPFTTADWKGKVILVDFWATWCGPCREELPRVKSLYSQYHSQGLEVLGVSNDMDVQALRSFVGADSGMPWPQLFDPQAAGQQLWNPITTGFGINGIPTMFLIDKNGICRSVTARQDMETQIPKLLHE